MFKCHISLFRYFTFTILALGDFLIFAHDLSPPPLNGDDFMTLERAKSKHGRRPLIRLDVKLQFRNLAMQRTIRRVDVFFCFHGFFCFHSFWLSVSPMILAILLWSSSFVPLFPTQWSIIDLNGSAYAQISLV